MSNARPYSGLPSYFSETQWATLYAISEAVIPVLSKEEEEALVASVGPGKDLEAVREYARTGATIDNVAFRGRMNELFETGLLPKQRGDIGLVLNLLSNWTFCRLFTFTAPMKDLPLKDRVELLSIWLGILPGTVPFPPLRLFARSIVSLIRAMYLQASAENSAGGMLKAMGYERPLTVSTGNFFKFDFLEPKDGEVIETDVAIVGSGPGAAIVSEKLSKAGYKVLVVEKGQWVPPSDLPLTEDRSRNLFESNMVFATDDGVMQILAGSTFGGGGTVNWSACLQPQAKVREEWVKTSGLEFFNSAEFQDSLDAVSERIGVAHVKRHNFRNMALLQGAHRMGYSHIEVPQNTGGEEHWDGHCGNGCGDGIEGKGCKTGPTRSTLPEAAKHGTKFVQNFLARRVTFDGKTATGIQGKWTSPSGSVFKVTIKAKRVVVAGGSLQTPLLLKRSGLSNPNIGSNLRLHPTSIITGIFPEKTKPLEGGILTTAVTEFEDLDGAFHGVKLETGFMSPMIYAASTPYLPNTNRADILKYDNAATFISLARDTGSGRVYECPETGRPKIDYTVQVADAKHIITGIIAIAKMAFSQGAVEIRCVVQGVKFYVRPEAEIGKNDPHASPSLKAWIAQLEGKIKEKSNPLLTVGCAHQMGTARMGKDYKTGAVDGKGRVWGKKGVYVADGSLFPTASGVNPQLTIMALADWVGRAVLDDLRSGGKAVARL